MDSQQNAHNHHPTLEAKPFDLGSISQVSKILAQSIFSIGRLHNDTRINASNVSSFSQLLRSHFTKFCLENLCSHEVVLAKRKLQSVRNRSYGFKIAGVIRIWKCMLECQYGSPTMFQFENCTRCIL